MTTKTSKGKSVTYDKPSDIFPDLDNLKHGQKGKVMAMRKAMTAQTPQEMNAIDKVLLKKFNKDQRDAERATGKADYTCEKLVELLDASGLIDDKLFKLASGVIITRKKGKEKGFKTVRKGTTK
jgi:hypothetical protein